MTMHPLVRRATCAVGATATASAFFFAAPAFAAQLKPTPSFSGPVNHSTSASASVAVAVGDVSGDGIADAVTANVFSNNISVLIGNGNGSFKSAVTYGAGYYPGDVALGDVNGDGRVDIVEVSSFDSTVSLFIGKGNGTFKPQLGYPVGGNPFHITVGDLNGDGRTDVVTSNVNSANVSVLLGKANGTLGAKADFGTGVGPLGVVARDVNGDGRLDIVAADSSVGKVSVLLGRGNGTFKPKADFPAGTGSDGLGAGDFNRDGHLDLAVTNTTPTNTATILLGNGKGAFTKQSPALVTGDNPDVLKVGDLNGDGKLDIANTNRVPQTVTVFMGKGNGTFYSAKSLGLGLTGSDSVGGLALGYVNGDRQLDIADSWWAGNSNGSVGTMLNSTPGQTVAGSNIPNRLKNRGTTVVNKVGAKTKQGQPLTAHVTGHVRSFGKTRGDIRCMQVIKGANRKVRIKLSGTCKMTIHVTYTAPATTKYWSYKHSATYKTRRVGT